MYEDFFAILFDILLVDYKTIIFGFFLIFMWSNWYKYIKANQKRVNDVFKILQLSYQNWKKKQTRI
jgi:hypothetical protein